MLLDGDIGSKDEQRFQVLNVLFNAFGFMAVGPGDNDVLGMALFQSIPFLVAEQIEVEDLNDVSMVKPGRDPRLVDEHQRDALVGQELGADDLDHDRAHEAVRADHAAEIHLAHAAARQQLVDVISAERGQHELAG